MALVEACADPVPWRLQGNGRLASGGVAEEIERLRAEPEEGDIAIGGAALAAQAAALGLIDEYRARVYPVNNPSRMGIGKRRGLWCLS